MKLIDIRIGMRVEAGRPGTEDNESGHVLDIDWHATDGQEVEVAWDQGIKTWCNAESLRPVKGP